MYLNNYMMKTSQRRGLLLFISKCISCILYMLILIYFQFIMYLKCPKSINNRKQYVFNSTIRCFFKLYFI